MGRVVTTLVATGAGGWAGIYIAKVFVRANNNYYVGETHLVGIIIGCLAGLVLSLTLIRFYWK